MKEFTLGKNPYECKQCDQCFSQVGNLRSPERFHSGEKPYECKQCGKCFTGISFLRRHRKSSHRGKILTNLNSVPGECCIQNESPSDRERFHTEEKRN